MKEHYWLENVLEDIVAYCSENGLESTRLVLSAAGAILTAESVTLKTEAQDSLFSDLESKNRKLH